jgi:protein-disulfide isomerase
MKNLIHIIFIIFILSPLSAFSNETSKPLPGRVLGDENATIIIEEYASMSCGHCANFHNKTIKDIKKEFIETGKAKLIFNDFPLDRGAMFGSMITQCMNDEQFFPVLNRLFQKQSQWTQSDNILNSINDILKPLGLEESTILSCIEETPVNQERWKSLLAGRKYAIDIKGVEATPTFFVNGKKVEGKFNIDTLRELLK